VAQMEKWGYIWKIAAHLKNAPNFAKCALLTKGRALDEVRDTWQSAALLEKCATVGKVRHSRKSAAHLEK